MGAYITININDMFAIQPEVLFMQRGGKIDEIDVLYHIDDDWVDGTWAMEAKHGYVEIPVLAKLSIPTDGALTPFFFAGPAVSFNLSAENEMAMEIPSYDWSETETEDDEDIGGIDFALVFGAGLGIAAGPGEIVVDLPGKDFYILEAQSLEDFAKCAALIGAAKNPGRFPTNAVGNHNPASRRGNAHHFD